MYQNDRTQLKKDIFGIDEKKRDEAFLALFESTHLEDDNLLKKIIQSDNKVIKIFLCKWLMQQKTSKRLIEILDVLLNDQEQDIQKEAANILKSQNIQKTLPYILTLLDSDKEDAILISLDIITQLKSSRAIAILENNYNDYSELVRKKVIRTLKVINSPTSFYCLKSILKKETDNMMKCDILKAVASFSWLSSAKIFYSYLFDNSASVRSTSAWALSKFISKKTARILTDRYQGEEVVFVKEQIIKSLQKQPPSSSLSFLLNIAIFDKEHNLRLLAFWLLDKYRDSFTQKIFLKYTSHSQTKMRAMVYRKIAFLGTKNAFKYLVKGLLYDDDENVRSAAADSMEAFETSESIEVLKIAIRKDSSMLVRYTATLAYLKLWAKTSFDHIKFILDLPEEKYAMEHQSALRYLTKYFTFMHAKVDNEFIEYLSEKIHSSNRNIRYLSIETMSTIHSLYSFDIVFRAFLYPRTLNEKHLIEENISHTLKKDYSLIKEIVLSKKYSLEELTVFFHLASKVNYTYEQLYPIKILLLQLYKDEKDKTIRLILLNAFYLFHKKSPENFDHIYQKSMLSKDQFFEIAFYVRDSAICKVVKDIILEKIDSSIFEERQQAMYLCVQMNYIDSLPFLIKIAMKSDNMEIASLSKNSIKEIVNIQ